MRSLTALVLATVVAAVLGAGCSGPPMPREPQSPANVQPPGSDQPTDAYHLVVGGADSVGSIPGSPTSPYVYIFRQTDPSSDRFTFQDRDLSFYFRPSPTVLHFQVENRKDRPVWIEWDRCTFSMAFGSTRKVANSDTRWPQRYAALPPTQLTGLQRYSNYVFPIDYLVDPGSSPDQLHRPLFPEDRSAPSYVDREFGVTLVFRIEDRLTPYQFTFKVRSVVSR